MLDPSNHPNFQGHVSTLVIIHHHTYDTNIMHCEYLKLHDFRINENKNILISYLKKEPTLCVDRKYCTKCKQI